MRCKSFEAVAFLRPRGDDEKWVIVVRIVSEEDGCFVVKSTT